jgi:hypothetical protein
VAFTREIVTDRVMDILVGKLLIASISDEIYKEYMTIGPGLQTQGASITKHEDQAPVGEISTDADGNKVLHHPDGSITVFYQHGNDAQDGED